MSSGDLHGPWGRVATLSKEFNKLPASGRFWRREEDGAAAVAERSIVPQVFYSTVPSEVILFDGQPTYTKIPGTQLVYANNTDSPLFVYSATQTYYYLAAGRWFSAPRSDGAMDVCVDGTATGFCARFLVESSERDIGLGAGYYAGERCSVDRANSHDDDTESSDGGGTGEG